MPSVALVGLGTIGASWASLFLSKGYRVLATDPAEGALKRSRAYILKALKVLSPAQNSKEHARIFDEQFSLLPDIKTALKDVEFVQENGPEKLDYKRSVFQMLDSHTSPTTVLASSSSGLPASRFSSNLLHPNRALIGHPFNPPHLLPLVELVPHRTTSEEALQQASEVYRHLGRKPVIVRQEIPGFVVNRLQAALVHEAYSLVARGIVSSADIDTMVSECIALRWAIQGPFLTKVLGGGGGGIDGYKHHLAHVGKAAEDWLADMREHRFQHSPENDAVLIENVQDQLKAYEGKDLKEMRDSFLIKVQELKGELQ